MDESLFFFPLIRSVIISEAIMLNKIPFPPKPRAKYVLEYSGTDPMKGSPSLV